MRPLPFLTLLLLFPLARAEEDPAATPEKTAKIDGSTEAAPAADRPEGPAPEGMVWIPGGNYTRGENRKLAGARSDYPEEQPVHRVTVDGFWMDETEVTNRQWKAFAEATGYKTQAERGWSSKDFPHAPPDQLKAGALCFIPPSKPVPLWQRDAIWQWWRFIEGANWQRPRGPGSSIKDKMDHPVVCITHEDALAYCKWAGKRLPTEAEWERAARGGLDHARYGWGDEQRPKGKWMANVFQGEFPQTDTGLDGFRGTSPVKTFPANAYGLYDTAGNVWEHCADLYRPEYYQTFTAKPHRNPTGPKDPISQPMLQAYQQAKRYPEGVTPVHKLAWLWVVKGGSHLCHSSYCLRYRPAARHFSESLSPTNHTGLRCVKSP